MFAVEPMDGLVLFIMAEGCIFAQLRRSELELRQVPMVPNLSNPGLRMMLAIKVLP